MSEDLPPTRKAYSYLRFSTLEQMKGDSFRRQHVLALEYAARKGLELDTKLTFRDLGVSAFRGRNAETGKLGEFLEAVKEGLVQPGSYLLVESLDRISRQAARKALRVLEDIVEEDITLVTLADGREYTKENLDNDPMSLIMALLTFIRANEESATKARRLKAVWENKRANAKERPLTARLPAWLTLDRETNQLLIDKDKAWVVRRVFELTNAGVGQHKIAETLNKEGVACFGKAAHWHRSYIKKIIENPAVVGRFVPHEVEFSSSGKKVRRPLQPIEGYFPSVVSLEVFDSVQARKQAGRAPIDRGEYALSNLLAGLAKCPVCGGTMTRVSKGSAAKVGKPFLVCQKAKVGAGCKYHSVPQELIETALIIWASDWIGERPSGSNELDEQLERARDGLSGINEFIENLVEQIGLGASPTLAKRLSHAEAEKEALEREVAELRLQIEETSPARVERRCQLLREVIEAEPLDRPRINSLLRQLLTSVVIDYRTSELVFKWLHGAESSLSYEPMFQPIMA